MMSNKNPKIFRR